jgi:hypothetical protein
MGLYASISPLTMGCARTLNIAPAIRYAPLLTEGREPNDQGSQTTARLEQMGEAHGRYRNRGRIAAVTAPLFSESQLQQLTIEALKNQLRAKLGGMVRSVKHISANTKVYRGVPWDSRPNLIAQLSYPPGDRAPLGRLNRPGQSVFYGSVAPPAVFYELKAREGSRIAFSEWEVMEPLWMHNLGYHVDALTRLGAAPNTARLPLTEPIPNETQRNKRLRKKVSLAFTVDVPVGFEYRYKQSVALTEFWCEHHQPLPVL